MEEVLETAVPPVPSKPVMLPVNFEDREDGLWLSYADYRNLEENIISLKEYISKLEIIVAFYTGEEWQK